MSFGSLKNVFNQMRLQLISLIYLNKPDSALNHPQWLICNKTKPNQTNNIWWGLVEKKGRTLKRSFFCSLPHLDRLVLTDQQRDIYRL